MRISLNADERWFLKQAMMFCRDNAMYEGNRQAAHQFLQRLRKPKNLSYDNKRKGRSKVA